MLDPDRTLERIWSETLATLEGRGWRSASEDLQRRLTASRSVSQSNELTREATALVLGTLQQKFGDLKAAAKTLVIPQESDHLEFITEASGVLAKVQSQLGRYELCMASLDQLVEAQNLSSHSPEVHLSTYWRIGFAAAMLDDRSRAAASFSDHFQRSLGSHSSQLANSLVFRCAYEILIDEWRPEEIREKLGQAFTYFLSAGVRADVVKFLNVGKSLVLPMTLAAVVSLRVKQTSQAVVQLALVHNLMRFESLSARSEGVAEIVHLLSRIDPKGLPLGTLKRWNAPDEVYRDWLVQRIASEFVVDRALEDANARFTDFMQSGTYACLWVGDSMVPGTHRAPSVPQVYFSWSGQRELGLELRLFLVEVLGLSVMDPDDSVIAGLSVSDRITTIKRRASYVVAELNDSNAFYVGLITQAMGLHRCLLLSDGPLKSTHTEGVPVFEVTPATIGSAKDQLRRISQRIIHNAT